MKRVLCLTAALFFAATPLAIAQPSHSPDQHASNDAPAHGRGADSRGGPDRHSGPSPQARHDDFRGDNRRFDWGAYRPGVRPPDWNRYGRNFDYRPFQRNYRADARFRWEPYRRPPGFYYRRWVFGEVFPRAFWARDYWLTDYYRFGLLNPPYGYVWVRYGEDAVLVNVYTGTILRVAYGVFY